MARPRNTVKTVQITISTTHMNKNYLETLVGHGSYGKNAAEAAERLVSEKLIELRRGSDDIAESLNETWQKQREPSG